MKSNHSHGAEGMSDSRLVIAVGINVLLSIAQVIGGLVAGSLALIADALHNFNDAASLGIALAARRIARRPADRQRTFGYHRATTIGALINLTTLIIVGLYLLTQAVRRYFEGQAVDGWIVVIVAGIALVVDIATALLTYAGSKQSLNVKAAFIHNVSDALASVGVIVAGTLILLYDLTIADLLATVAISGYILYQGVTLIGRTIRILMESVPEDIRRDGVVRELQAIDGVLDVHHIHTCQLDEESHAFEAHEITTSWHESSDRDGDSQSELVVSRTQPTTCPRRFSTFSQHRLRKQLVYSPIWSTPRTLAP